ncbi:MAG: OB-fold domain-containing protein [Dehalococcoidia bacterium]
MTERRPNRTLGANHDTFWAYCNRGELRLQRCDACAAIQWPPAPLCNECLGDRFTWTEMSGQGTIETYCTFERPYHKECVPPWEVILVQLDEGPLFISNASGFVAEGMPRGTAVRVAFVDCEDDAGPFRLPVFELA